MATACPAGPFGWAAL